MECQIKPHLECHIPSSLSQCQCIDGCKCGVCPDQSRALGVGLLDRCVEKLHLGGQLQPEVEQALRAQNGMSSGGARDLNQEAASIACKPPWNKQGVAVCNSYPSSTLEVGRAEIQGHSLLHS